MVLWILAKTIHNSGTFTGWGGQEHEFARGARGVMGVWSVSCVRCVKGCKGDRREGAILRNTVFAQIYPVHPI